MTRTLLLAGLISLVASHPCEDEVASACPDRPGAEMAKCLKNPEDHESKTTLSSDCADFVALNNACAEDIEKFCDEAYFTDDTTLCLTQWTDQESLSEQCQKVLKWAVPQKDEDEEDEDGDEDSEDATKMTEQEKQEKEEWRAKRKKEREAAMERMAMKEVDRKKEEDRVALEKFKTENPEEYAEMIKQQEEEKRQQAEFKKRERQRAAALERQRRAAAAEDAEDEQESQRKTKKSGGKKKGSSWSGLLTGLGVLGLIAGGYYVGVQAGFIKTNKAGGGKKKGKRG